MDILILGFNQIYNSIFSKKKKSFVIFRNAKQRDSLTKYSTNYPVQCWQQKLDILLNDLLESHLDRSNTITCFFNIFYSQNYRSSELFFNVLSLSQYLFCLISFICWSIGSPWSCPKGRRILDHLINNSPSHPSTLIIAIIILQKLYNLPMNNESDTACILGVQCWLSCELVGGRFSFLHLTLFNRKFPKSQTKDLSFEM